MELASLSPGLPPMVGKVILRQGQPIQNGSIEISMMYL